jgi:hypothetical protein
MNPHEFPCRFTKLHEFMTLHDLGLHFFAVTGYLALEEHSVHDLDIWEGWILGTRRAYSLWFL